MSLSIPETTASCWELLLIISDLSDLWHFFLCYTQTWQLMNYFPYSTNSHKCEPAFCSRVIIIKTLSFFPSAKRSSFNLSYPPACVLFHYSWQIVGWNNKRFCAVMFNIQFSLPNQLPSHMFLSGFTVLFFVWRDFNVLVAFPLFRW